MVLSGLWGFAQVARMLYASRSHVACKLLGRSTTSRAVCQLVIFEQNMPESSQSDGRLVDRKHTLRPRNEIVGPVRPCLYSGEPWSTLRSRRSQRSQLSRRSRHNESVVFEQNMPESSQSDGRLLKRKYTLRPRNDIAGPWSHVEPCGAMWSPPTVLAHPGDLSSQ